MSSQRVRWPLLAMLFVAGLAAHAGEGTTPANPLSDKLDDLVRREMTERKLPSLALVVMKGNVIVRQAAYGWARIEPPIAAAASTRYRLDSLTKQFTAAAILILQQQGRLRVEDPVRKYLPKAPPSWDKITIRDLLTHTAGFPRDSPAGYSNLADQSLASENLLALLYKMQPLTSPGTRWKYSNAGYAILGAIVEAVSGQGYAAFLEQNIFSPAGMSDTRLDDENNNDPNFAAGYIWQASSQHWQSRAPGNPPMAAAGIRSTVLDLAKWEMTLHGETILTTESKKQMWSPLVLKNGDEYDYGFGWLIDDCPLGRFISHGGSGWGYSTAYHRYPDAGYTVIVLTNLQPGKGNYHADAIAHSIAAIYEPVLAGPVQQPKAKPLLAESER